jgi:hypothetical protein
MDYDADFNNYSGWFDPWYQDLTNKQIAEVAFGYFVEKSFQLFNGKREVKSVDFLINFYGRHADQLSEGIRIAEVSIGDLRDAMVTLASNSGGNIPTNIGGFISALSGQLTSTPFVDASLKVVTKINTATEVITKPIAAASKVTEAVADNMKLVTYTVAILGTLGLGAYALKQAGFFAKVVSEVVKK